MSKLKKNTLNENAVIWSDLPQVALGWLTNNDTLPPGFPGINDALGKTGTYVKFVQPETKDGKTVFKTFNVNSQVNLQQDLSQCEIIVEPDQDSETEAAALVADLKEVYAHVNSNASAEQAKDLPVKLLLKQNGSKTAEVGFAYTKSPALNVVFVFAREYFSDLTVDKLKAALDNVSVFVKEDMKQAGANIDDKSAEKFFEKHTGAVEVLKAIGKTGNELLSDESYNSFVIFSSDLYVASQFTTVGKPILDKYDAEVKEIIALAKDGAAKKAEETPAEKTEPGEKPDPAKQSDANDAKGDGEKTGAGAQTADEKPNGPKTLNIIQDQQINANGFGSTHHFMTWLVNHGKGCIVSPYPLESLKMEIGGLPDQAKAAITAYTGGKDLLYFKADGGKPVMSAADPTKVDGSKLYNQVVHQLDGWYVFAPNDGQAFNKMLFLFKKKHDKAIFELQSFKPEIPLHIAKLSGNKWVTEFYTEQNTLKKQGCRTLLWSTNDSKFGNAASTHASPSAAGAGQPGQTQAKKPVMAQSDIQKRKYVSEIIMQRLKNMLSQIWKHTMKIHAPVLNKQDAVLIACNGGWHKLTEKEWQKMADSFDDIKDFSPFGPASNVWVKKLAACFDVSSINTSQFDVQEPLPEEQEKAVKSFSDLFTKEFADLGLDGIGFQIVAPGRKPKYDVNTSIMQGSGWELQDSYTLTVMVPGVNPAKFYDGQADIALEKLGVGKEIKAVLDKINEGQAEKVGLALCLDNGFPS